MKVNQIECGEECEELMVFGTWNPDGGTAKDGIAPMHEAGSFEEERVGIGIRRASVVEVGSVLHTHAGLDR